MSDFQYKAFVGIDVSKEFFDVAEVSAAKSKRFPNSSEGFAAFVQEQGATLAKALVVLETTGGYERGLLHWLCGRDYAVHRADTGHALKGKMKKINRVALVFAFLAASIGQSFCQTNLQFTGISVTDEGNMHLTWSSVSNEVYEVDEADSLIDTNTGSTTWNLLYDDYPSQGTNTFWLDTGNYNLNPQILNPKDMPMRFYRIVDLGSDTTSDEPTVSITSPTNGTAVTGELTITVTAATDQPVTSGTKLYVDGQEMQMADSTTNYAVGSTNYEVDTYSINTCEWGNETHTLFATVECQSGFGDAVGSPAIATGHGVSPFVPVLFSNLITRYFVLAAVFRSIVGTNPTRQRGFR